MIIMNALSPLKTQVLSETSAWKKIDSLDSTIEDCLRGRGSAIPLNPGRDVQIVPLHLMPSRKGLSYKEGQARLLHDLASIEMQAMELNIRTLVEFPYASQEFKYRLAEVTREEGRHLKLCLSALDSLGYQFGDFPANLSLWNAVDSSDCLLDRIMIVHRYLEGAGLDAGDSLLNKLRSVPSSGVRSVVQTIAHEEIGHVQFGTDWYLSECRMQKIDPTQDFVIRLKSLSQRLPRRMEKMNHELRRQAGFSDFELIALENFRQNQNSPGLTSRH